MNKNLKEDIKEARSKNIQARVTAKLLHEPIRNCKYRLQDGSCSITNANGMYCDGTECEIEDEKENTGKA